MRTKVAIIGAGPAGMFLAHILKQSGVDAVVIERRDRDSVEGSVRSEVVEQITVDQMARLGLDGRLHELGLPHGGTNIACDGDVFRVDMEALTGDLVTVYGQQEVMKDLFDAAEARGLNLVFDAEDVALHGLDAAHPHVTWRKDGQDRRVDAEIVVGCDGFHGVSRRAIPDDVLKVFERVYPFGWLGVLAEVPPCADELIYANSERGFALASMRSQTRSRYYIQCSLDDDIEDWSDDRFWDELCLRLGPEAARNVVRGPSFEKSIAPLRSFVCEPMRWGRLMLAGDAAHIVPPTGAKGLNLAVSDVILLSEAVEAFFASGDEAELDRYSVRALARVWKAERFSWWFTGLTHRFPDMDAFDRKVQAAKLAYIKSSTAAQTVLAENYVGLPLT